MSHDISAMEIPLKSQPKVAMVHLQDDRYRLEDYRLARTFSDAQVNNYDEETGTKLFDDGRIRPKRTAPSQIHSAAHGGVQGIEDEYIPGLNFADMVYQWGDTPDLSRTNSNSAFLDLADLHAKVMPQRIQKETPKLKKFKSNQSDFDSILGALPSNFSDLPYSQRKKLVKSINDSIDYSQFASYVKSYFGKSTVAGRLLSSTTDLKNLSASVNVNEKGARVMEFELGKVIGFGAWGTIRECFNSKNEVYAMKIVANKSSNPLNVFRQEISIWKQLHHPHILELIKYVECNDTIFCVMRRINGGTLFDVVARWGVCTQPDRRRVTLTETYARQIVSAVRYLHETGVVHGDVKLENVLVQKDDPDEMHHQMILCDFGMSRFYKSKSEVRSKSSMSEVRKPYDGGESYNSRRLLGELNNKNMLSMEEFRSQSRPASPSRNMRRWRISPDLLRSPAASRDQSPDRRSANSLDAIKQFLQDLKQKEIQRQSAVDLNLPDSHIGSLPYASPELLLPNPPPLGPSADIWALGVLLYTMVLGALPFHHSYEPRLRAMIIQGKYNNEVMAEMMGVSVLVSIISGSLELDITKRLDIDTISTMMAHTQNAPMKK